MKKTITLALVLVLALSLLTACGGDNNDGSSTTPPANSGTTTTPPADNTPSGGGDTTSGNNDSANTADLTTVAGFLAAFGLTEDDLKCANFTRIDKTAYTIDEGPDYGKISEVGAYISKALTDEEVRAWLEQILAKLNSLSGDGKIDNLFESGTALTVDYIMEHSTGSIYQGSGYYNYNGKRISAQICVIKGYLDNADPNEAMAACTLRLEM
jgi:hypothetical protein